MSQAVPDSTPMIEFFNFLDEENIRWLRNNSTKNINIELEPLLKKSQYSEPIHHDPIEKIQLISNSIDGNPVLCIDFSSFLLVIAQFCTHSIILEAAQFYFDEYIVPIYQKGYTGFDPEPRTPEEIMSAIEIREHMRENIDKVAPGLSDLLANS